MKEERVQLWINSLDNEIKAMETEFNSFFKRKNIHDYYKIRIDNEIGFISIELVNREQLPIEVIDTFTVALLRSKPRF